METKPEQHPRFSQSGDQVHSERPPGPKKPYAKPALVYRAPLEAMAGTCTGTGGKATIVFCSLVQS